jgi:hypothetical protein
MKFNYNLLNIVLENLSISNLINLKLKNTVMLQKLSLVKIKIRNPYPYTHFKEIDKDKDKDKCNITDLIEMKNGNIIASYTHGYIKVFSWKSPFKLIYNFKAHEQEITSLCTFKEILVSFDNFGILRFWKEQSIDYCFECIKGYHTECEPYTQVLCTSNGDIVKVWREDLFVYGPTTYISLYLANSEYAEFTKLSVDEFFYNIHLLDNGKLCIIFGSRIRIYDLNYGINEILDSFFYFAAQIIPKNCVYEYGDKSNVLPYYSDLLEDVRKSDFKLPHIIMNLRDGRCVIQLKDFRLYIIEKGLKPIKYLGNADHVTRMIRLKNGRIVFSAANNIFILK